MEEDSSKSKLKNILFGSIGRKLGLAFGVLTFLLIVLVLLTYNLNNQMQKDTLAIKNVEAPLEVMVEQVIGYDALLTGNAHEALLHAEKGEFSKIEEHKKKYDEIGLKLDNLLKIEAKALINKSTRSEEDKQSVYNYLEQLDKINLALVDLETQAFDSMAKGDIDKARSLIVSDQYEKYKAQLADLYNTWAEEETKITNTYRQKIIDNTFNVRLYNLGFGILFVLVAMIIPFLINSSVSKPIKELKMATEELAKGNYKTRVNIKTNDEIEGLGNTFNETAEKLDRLEEERKQIDKAKTEFLSITSHELRSPMTPMKAQLQMLEGDFFGKLNKEQKEAVEVILRNTERLDKIIVDFLEISRIEAARLKFNFIKINLKDYIKRLAEEMEAFLPEKKIKIELNIGELPVIEVDPDRTMQVLRNLVNNAKKFTPQNGKIIVSANKKDGQILFSVKDNGVGIKKEAQGRVFEPFFQVDNMYQHQSGGTGLGLAICKGIVESQNGKIWFESDEGKGTVFYFTIPLVPVREIKPIRVLFSANQDIERKVKEIFLEMLGPLGQTEFEDLKQQGILEESLLKYVDFLKTNKIILNSEEFKNKIRLLFIGDKKEEEMKSVEKIITPEDLSKFVKGGKK